MIQRFCVSHKQPLLPQQWYDDCISLGDFEPDSRLHVSQLDQFWHRARPLSYGAAGSYVLPIAIEKYAGAAELIEISSYRKRTLPSAEGTESRKYPTMRELSLEGFDREAELSTFTPGRGVEFLVPQPMRVKKTIVGNYAAIHHRKDILDYASLAVEVGVLDKNSAAEFLAGRYFIPGGVELGIYPRAWLVDVLSSLELVGRHFVERYADRLKKYNRFQIRAVGFLGERLGSYFLLRHLTEKYSNHIPAEVFGHMTVIVEDTSKYSAGLADRPATGSGWSRLNPRRAG